MSMGQPSGLIERAFLAGSHDPQTYYRKYPRSQWIQKGGYEIQTTPGEIAAVISHTKPYLRGHRMLCVGTETLGSERFIAEALGILEMDVIGDALPLNLAKLRELKTVNMGKAPEGQYDIITVFGKADVSKVLNHCKIGTFVICLGVGTKAQNPELRQAWMKLRKAYMAVLQTGGSDFETGVGVVKVLYVNNPAPVVLKAIEPEVEDAAEKEEPEALESKAAKMEPRLTIPRKAEGSAPVADKPAEAPVKRRGRQLGSKNKVKG